MSTRVYAFVSTLIVLLGVSTAPVSAQNAGDSQVGQDQFTIIFDEVGNGFYRVFNAHTGGYGPSTPAHVVISGDNFFSYRLPVFVVEGDVAVREPGSLTIDDGIRFVNDLQSGLVHFYSDREPGLPPVPVPTTNADTGFPSYFTPTVFIDEVGAEGNNGFQYVGGPGNPADSNFYNGISDRAVPEPSSIVLFGLGVAALIGRGVRRWKLFA